MSPIFNSKNNEKRVCDYRKLSFGIKKYKNVSVLEIPQFLMLLASSVIASYNFSPSPK
jgi:hypothetical protein